MECGTIIGARQIKAARALLDWSQEDLSSATQLSVATIRKLELGFISPRNTTTSVLRKALEDSGIEFLDSEGVRRRQEEVKTFFGTDGYKTFLDDMSNTARQCNAPVMMVIPTQHLNENSTDHILERIGAQSNDISARIIMTDTPKPPASTSRLEYRSLSSRFVDPLPCCIYGDKYALFASQRHRTDKIIVIQSTTVATASRKQFESLWEKAVSLDNNSFLKPSAQRN